MEFTQLIAQRYSCKNFGTGKVDAAALHTILEAGRLAPTAKNTQEQRIYVVQSEEGLAKIPAATVPPSVWWSPMTRTTPLLTPANG
jgi:nitroreductase